MVRPLPAYAVYLIIEGVFGFAFITFSTLSMLYRIDVVGLNPFQLVLVGTALEIAAFSFEIPTGILADLYSRRLSVIVGMFVVGIGFMFEGLLPYFVTVLIAQVIWGAGWTFISGAREAWIADELGEEGIGRVYLRGSQIHQAGWILGVPLAVALGSITIALPLVVGGALFVALGVFLVVVMPEHGFTPAPRGERTTFGSMRDTFTEGIGAIRGRPVLITITAIAVLWGAASEGYDRLWAKHLVDNFSFPDLPTGPLDNVVVWFGLIEIVGMGISIAMAEVLRRRINTDSHLAVARALLLSTLIIAGSLVGFALAGSFGLALTFIWTIAIFRELNYPLTIAWLNQSLSSRVRATVMSIRSQADALGQMFGGPVLGLIATVVSLRVNFLVTAAIVLPALWLYTRTLRVREE
ncbi:MAG TPA: MFS transporter [Thermomicrobiales bacterium]|nr:MFS transporter [Thermomicrobiales bacterium]